MNACTCTMQLIFWLQYRLLSLMAVICCLEVQTYRQYADDSHLPRIFMVHSGIPTLAAVIVAILKL